jgi:uncharacterized protein
MPNITKRILDVYAKVETRKDNAGKMYIEGMIPFNSDSEDLGGFIERIDPVAFNQTLSRGSNVYAFWAHDESRVLASTGAKTLTLTPDSIGLRFTAELRSGSADEFEAIARGDVVGVSFGFITRKDEWDLTVDPAIRTLKEVQLLEVSPGVAFPAYPGAQSAAALRALDVDRARLSEMRSKYQATAQIEKPLDAPLEQPDALESRQRAELAILRARVAIG